MRQRKARATAGQVHERSLLSKQNLTICFAILVAAWVGVTFSQEALLSHRLSTEAAQLQQQNAQIRADNERYRRDILSLASGNGIEEEARLNGYAKPDEKVFLIVDTPPARPPAPRPSPPPAPRPSPPPATSADSSAPPVASPRPSHTPAVVQPAQTPPPRR